MRFSKFLFTLITLSIFSVSLLTFTGCGPEKYQLPEAEKSPQGVSLEDFIPEDAMMALSINTLDKTQREKFENLKSYFPSKDYDNLIKSALDDMNMKLSDMGLSYEKDIAPIFSNEFKGIISMSGNFPVPSKLKKTGTKGTKDPKEAVVQPDVIFAFTVADTKKAEELLTKIAEKNSDAVSVKIFEYQGLDNEKENMYIALYKDTVVMANTANKRFEAVKRARNNENSILSNENYKKAIESLPRPNLGVAYINMNRLFTEIAKADESMMPDKSIIDAMQYESFAYLAENDGLKMIVQVGMDPNNKKFNIDTFPYKDPYLYKNIPGKDLIIYAEAYGIKDIIDLELDMLLTTKEDKEDYERIKRLLKSYTDLDLEKDILSWMDKGYSVVLQRNDGIIPGISIYIDAETEPKAAKKTADLIDTAFQQLFDTVMTDGDPLLAKILTKEIVSMGETGDKLNKLSIDFTALTEEELAEVDIPLGLFNEPIEIYYGLTKNNLFVFSTYTGLADEWGQKELTVAENPDVKESIGYLKDYPYQLSYVNIEELVKYADRFIELMEAVKGQKLPKDVAEAIAKAREYLAPIKYLVGGNQKVENIAEGMMFIKMEKPEVPEEAEAPAEE